MRYLLVLLRNVWLYRHFPGFVIELFRSSSEDERPPREAPQGASWSAQRSVPYTATTHNSRMPHFSALPVELARAIFADLRAHFDPLNDYPDLDEYREAQRTLTACALVSRMWRDIAQPLAFETLRIGVKDGNAGKCGNLTSYCMTLRADLLRSADVGDGLKSQTIEDLRHLAETSPHLVERTHTVSVVPHLSCKMYHNREDRPTYWVEYRPAISFLSLGGALAQFPSLHTLSLHNIIIDFPEPKDSHDICGIGTQMHSSVKLLKVSASGWIIELVPHAFFLLLNLCPELDSLSLKGIRSSTFPFPFEPDVETMKCLTQYHSLKSIKLEYTLSMLDIMQMMAVNGSLPSLKALDVGDLHADELETSLQGVLDRAGGGIKSFSLEYNPDTSIDMRHGEYVCLLLLSIQ